MALFFDRGWFDDRMAALGLDLVTIAKVLGLTEFELAEVWKDQRELTARDVSLLSALLAAPTEEIAHHAGVSTPTPRARVSLDEIDARLSQIERKLDELTALVRDQKAV